MLFDNATNAKENWKNNWKSSTRQRRRKNVLLFLIRLPSFPFYLFQFDGNWFTCDVAGVVRKENDIRINETFASIRFIIKKSSIFICAKDLKLADCVEMNFSCEWFGKLRTSLMHVLAGSNSNYRQWRHDKSWAFVKKSHMKKYDSQSVILRNFKTEQNPQHPLCYVILCFHIFPLGWWCYKILFKPTEAEKRRQK